MASWGRGVNASATPTTRRSPSRRPRCSGSKSSLPNSATSRSTFAPASAPVSPRNLADDEAGTFTWRWPNQPASLTSLWTQGMFNVITKGAVMSFESQHGLANDGIAGPKVWGDLLNAATAGDADSLPYGYVYVTKNLPETVTVYVSGTKVYSTLANTGVNGAATPDGTFPVFERFTVTTMRAPTPTALSTWTQGSPG